MLERSRKRIMILIFMATALVITSLTPILINAAGTKSNVEFSGARSSGYGIKPFPSDREWGDSLKGISSKFPGSKTVGIWLVGEVDFETKGMDLEFPSDGKSYPLITFADKDKHENTLSYFDKNNIKVFLQLEPGNADVKTLIDLVLNRYKKHPSVIGVGIDVEWYKNAKDGGSGSKVSDTLAKDWEQSVKAHNSAYRLFIKHYDKKYLCPKYRGDIIFVNDSEDNGNFNNFMKEMTDFGKTFYPNTVLYQIGYPSDKSWWKKMKDPIKEMGAALSSKTKQSCGIIWVDFSLKDIRKTLVIPTSEKTAKPVPTLTKGRTTSTPSTTDSDKETPKATSTKPTSTPQATVTSLPTHTPGKDTKTVLCSTTIELQNALKNAQPGNRIVLKSGNYTATSSSGSGYFSGSNNGTAVSHIILESENPHQPAVLMGNGTKSGYVLHILGDYWDIRNIKVSNGQKGIMLDNASHITISNCEIYNIGEEGIHLRDGSSENCIENSNVHDTGKLTPGFGEGIYVGSDRGKWGQYNKECNQNIVKNCTIGPNVTAEHVDIKEGTVGTIIENCTFDGAGMSGANYADSFIDAKGNQAIIRGNTGNQSNNSKIVDAFQVHQQQPGCGLDNHFINNIVNLNNTTAYVVNAPSGSATASNNSRSPVGMMYKGNVKVE